MRAKRLDPRLILLLGAILLASASLVAQQTGSAESEEVNHAAKVLRVRSEDTEQIAELLRGFGVGVNTSRQLGIITVSGDPNSVARAEEAVREIEALTMRTPGSSAEDVELTVHFLGITDQDSPPPGPLREVVAELKKTFPFQGYKLLETIALRTQVGHGSEIEGILPENLTEGTPPKKYTFVGRVNAIEPRRDSHVIRFGVIRAVIRLPIRQGESVSFEEVEINTGLDVPDGKTVVVGKAGAVGESQGYLLVLTAKVVN